MSMQCCIFQIRRLAQAEGVSVPFIIAAVVDIPAELVPCIIQPYSRL